MRNNRAVEPEPLYGATDPEAVIPMDSMERSFVDEIARDYNVRLEYDEGEAYIHGVSNEEVEEFVDDIYRAERSMEGSNHPEEFGFPETEFSINSALENPEAEIDRGERIIMDGGKTDNPADHDPRYENRNEPYTGEEPVTDGGVVEFPYQNDEKVSGILLAGFPADVERTRVNDSGNYMGAF